MHPYAAPRAGSTAGAPEAGASMEWRRVEYAGGNCFLTLVYWPPLGAFIKPPALRVVHDSPWVRAMDGRRHAGSVKYQPFLTGSNASGASKSLTSAHRSFCTVRGLRSTTRANWALVG